MRKKLVAISLAIILVGMFGMVAMAEEDVGNHNTSRSNVPFHLAAGVNLTSYGWMLKPGVEIGPVGIYVVNNFKPSTEFAEYPFMSFFGYLDLVGPLLALNYPRFGQLSMVFEAGYLYSIPAEAMVHTFGIGLEYYVDEWLSLGVRTGLLGDYYIDPDPTLLDTSGYYLYPTYNLGVTLHLF